MEQKNSRDDGEEDNSGYEKEEDLLEPFHEEKGYDILNTSNHTDSDKN